MKTYTETEWVIAKMINRLAELDGYKALEDPTEWIDRLNNPDNRHPARIFRWEQTAKALYRVITDTF